MKRINYKVVNLIFFPFLFLLIGCAEKVDNNTDEYIQTIEAVLHNTLTGPNDKLKEIVEIKDGKERTSALTKYEATLYRDFFANETVYNDFLARYGTLLLTEAYKNKYIFKVETIEYERAHSKENIYNFSIELQYQKEGQESPEGKKITGQADLNDEHKIERMLIRVNDLWGSFPNYK
jgi:hypothetical protein